MHSAAQAECDRVFQVFKIGFIAAHRLADIIGELRDRSAVDILQLDDDIQRGFLCVIRAERTDAERDLRLVTEVVIELLCAVEIKAVTEQQQLGFRVYAVLFVVCNHLLAPCIGVAAVMPDAGEVVDHGAVEIQQECRISPLWEV